MRILNIKFCGNGSEKQVEWATSIFNAEIQKISDHYEAAKLRVSNKSMPQRWADSWTTVLSDPKAIGAVERFAAQSASVTIDYKGWRTKSGTTSIPSILESFAVNAYEAA